MLGSTLTTDQYDRADLKVCNHLSIQVTLKVYSTRNGSRSVLPLNPNPNK